MPHRQERKCEAREVLGGDNCSNVAVFISKKQQLVYDSRYVNNNPRAIIRTKVLRRVHIHLCAHCCHKYGWMNIIMRRIDDGTQS